MELADLAETMGKLTRAEILAVRHLRKIHVDAIKALDARLAEIMGEEPPATAADVLVDTPAAYKVAEAPESKAKPELKAKELTPDTDPDPEPEPEAAPEPDPLPDLDIEIDPLTPMGDAMAAILDARRDPRTPKELVADYVACLTRGDDRTEEERYKSAMNTLGRDKRFSRVQRGVYALAEWAQQEASRQRHVMA